MRLFVAVVKRLSQAAGVVAALGTISAFGLGGRPVYIMPLVFGGAPITGALLTLATARKLKQIGPAFLAGLLTLLGTLACIIPGLILACIFFVAVPATMVERAGPIEALKRSAELTTGHRLPIFGAMFLVFVVFGVVGAGFSWATPEKAKPKTRTMERVNLINIFSSCNKSGLLVVCPVFFLFYFNTVSNDFHHQRIVFFETICSIGDRFESPVNGSSQRNHPPPVGETVAGKIIGYESNIDIAVVAGRATCV